MTMRVRNEPEHVRPTLDPDKSYAFTWPGQPRRLLSGRELAELIKGANPEMLDIKEADAGPTVPGLGDEGGDK